MAETSGWSVSNNDWPSEPTQVSVAEVKAAMNGLDQLLESEPTVVEEYGQLMSGGGVNVWNLRPELLEHYPLAERIEHGKRFGGRVLRRRVIVIDEWEEL